MPTAASDLVLLITGVATCGALFLFLFPAAALERLFGQKCSDDLTLFVARNWGLLVFLVGGLLVYAAFHPATRTPTLIAAFLEKAAFAVGVFVSPFRRRLNLIAIASADAAMAVTYFVYLTVIN